MLIKELLKETGLSRRTINYLLARGVIEGEYDAAHRLHFGPSVLDKLRELYKIPARGNIVSLNPPSDLVSESGLSPFVFEIKPPKEPAQCVVCGGPQGECKVTYRFWWDFGQQVVRHRIDVACASRGPFISDEYHQCEGRTA